MMGGEKLFAGDGLTLASAHLTQKMHDGLAEIVMQHHGMHTICPFPSTLALENSVT